mgnify:CR=1 FL=1|tara:strand:- start:32 stop:763 length:732 start_codon:yes stop_codon:yes gene_type:complete
MIEVRIQKIISDAGICSRRKAEDLITQNRVQRNGKDVFIGDKADIEKDQIYLDGKKLEINKRIKVILLNKPKGYICSCKDTHGRPTILELLPRTLQSSIHPIGRLDLNSRGAILLTNNGDLTMKLTHPRYLHPKTYHVLVKGLPSEKSLNAWRNGVMIYGKQTQKAEVSVIKQWSNKSLLKVILKEGRKRQIRIIADMIKHPVIDLQRTAINDIKLNGLEEGKWRILDKSKWEKLILPIPNSH